MVKKVLVHDRRTIEIWYGLPGPNSIEHWENWLPGCASVRRESDEPEVCIRIVHKSFPGRGDPSAYCQQTVEIAAGGQLDFETGTHSCLTRRLLCGQIVSAAPRTSTRKRKSPRKPGTPRVTVLLRKATEWRRLLDSGELPSQADIARREGLTRARITQILGLLRLCSEIQEAILSLPKTSRRLAITERALRPIVLLEDSRKQLEAFGQLVEATGRH
jgi:hypothetical protein